MSGPLILNTGTPQGFILSPLLYNIYTHDCIASSSSTSIIKFADDTVVLGLITGNNEQGYLNQVADLVLWCQTNNLALNINKTKEMVVDFQRKQGSGLTPLIISGEPVERVPSLWGTLSTGIWGAPHSGSLMVFPHTWFPSQGSGYTPFGG